ncbi:hypothetical protein D5S18_34040 [Nocardia panacis]|uniref:Uncharacterized protein n=1 Tax=Nocardia panacis TaxID=2340916 RepID=A0A3A4K859_9NOCA|nr:hypothetical protein [Nocardia panacis]RJO68424.1 hypothetical protein D5S18_34040 [Nocardia panacis]
MSSSKEQALQIVLDQLDVLSKLEWDPDTLVKAIDIALSVPAPAGNPTTIAAQSQSYGTRAQLAFAAGIDLTKMSASDLPASWRGQAAESALNALGALLNQIGMVKYAYQQGHDALDVWSRKLREAQRQDTHGRNQLNQARNATDGLKRQTQQHTYRPNIRAANMASTMALAKEGCRDLIAAVRTAEGGANYANSRFRTVSQLPRASQLVGPGIDRLTATTLVYSNLRILSSAAIAQASQQYARMSDADRKRFGDLVAGAQSPEEAAYLWDALGSGHTLDEISEFDKVIHPFGNDPQWLAKHLRPQLSSGTAKDGADSTGYLTYGGAAWAPGSVYPIYSQGAYGDCVAAATTMAMLNGDPVKMLGVTTGRGPAGYGGAAVDDDSAAAVQARLQSLYLDNHRAGQAADGRAVPDPQVGVGPVGNAAQLASLLSPITGSEYRLTNMETESGRRAALPEIQSAVAAGKPAPITLDGTVQAVSSTGDHHRPEVTDTAISHQVIVVGATDDRLQIYNPWGYTQWISTADFVKGNFGAIVATHGGTQANALHPREAFVPG